MSNDPKGNFPIALQYYMSINGKKQQDLIKDLSVTSSAISQWVNGKVFPRMDKVEMLANYFHITTTDLLTNPHERKTQSSDPFLIAKLLESNQPLYELLTSAINLQEPDLILLKGIADRFNQLREGEL